MGLYPNYRPLGVKKAWDHLSVTVGSAGKILRKIGVPVDFGDPIEAVAWIDESDDLRVMVADFSNGRRVTLRQRRSGYRLEMVTPERER